MRKYCLFPRARFRVFYRAFNGAFWGKIPLSAALALLTLIWLVNGMNAAVGDMVEGVVGDAVEDVVEGEADAFVQSGRSLQEQPVLVLVDFHTPAELQWLAAHIDVWQVDHAAQTVTALVRKDQMPALQARGYQVVRADAQPKAPPLTDAAAQLGGDDGTISGFACYRTVEKTFADLAKLEATHPNLAQWIDIGDSWDKQMPDGPDGHDLSVLVLTNRQSDVPKARFFLMAAIHARELVTAETATRFAEYLVNNYGVDPDITWMLDYNEVHILPIANPDGRKWAEQLYYWRKNTNTTDSCIDGNTQEPWFPNYGVDLNRNGSFKWNGCQGSGCSSGDSCSLTFRGRQPASEPETQAIQNYVAAIFPDQRGSADGDVAPSDATGLLISLHSYSQLVLFPWGWSDAPSPNHVQLETLGRKFGYFTGYDVCQSGEPGCIYQTDGSTDDWSYGELGIASYTFELGTEFFQSCPYFEDYMLADTLASLRYAVKAARRPYMAPAGPETLAVQPALPVIEVGTALTVTARADDTRFASNGWGDEPTQPIAAARYSINAPAWITDTALFSLTNRAPLLSGTVAMTATDGRFDTPVETVQTVIDTSGWPVGRHLIFVESQDANGVWGTPSAAAIDVVAQLIYSATLASTESVAIRPGIPLSTSLLLRNTGTAPDSYQLHYALDDVDASAAWQVAVPPQVDALAVGDVVPIAITITPPINATVGVTKTILISATSQATAQTIGPGQVHVQVLPHQIHVPFAPR